jgi:hypothetical protein
MAASLTIDEIIERIQFLRLALLPAYAEDGDEGERSIEDYVAFFRTKLNEAITATSRYIKSLEVLLGNRSSDEALNRYLVARKAFVEAFPFSEEVFPAASSPEYQPAYAFVKSAFTGNMPNAFSTRDLEKLREYQSLLTELQRLLPR